MTIIKKFLEFLTAFLLGFGFWYIIFWFIINEPNLFLWSVFAKIIYLFLGILMFGRVTNEFGWASYINKFKNSEENEI